MIDKSLIIWFLDIILGVSFLVKLFLTYKRFAANANIHTWKYFFVDLAIIFSCSAIVFMNPTWNGNLGISILSLCTFQLGWTLNRILNELDK